MHNTFLLLIKLSFCRTCVTEDPWNGFLFYYLDCLRSPFEFHSSTWIIGWVLTKVVTTLVNPTSHYSNVKSHRSWITRKTCTSVGIESWEREEERFYSLYVHYISVNPLCSIHIYTSFFSFLFPNSFSTQPIAITFSTPVSFTSWRTTSTARVCSCELEVPGDSPCHQSQKQKRIPKRNKESHRPQKRINAKLGASSGASPCFFSSFHFFFLLRESCIYMCTVYRRGFPRGYFNQLQTRVHQTFPLSRAML